MRHVEQAWRFVIRLLRELADEEAYRRHLQHHGKTASPEEWRRFCQERLRWRYGNPRCC